MRYQKICARCFSKKVYIVRREKYKCANCKYEWKPYKLPLHLSRREWIKILGWFLRGLSSQAISNETGINRWRILRALTKVRMAMIKDVPDVFNGIVEVDETYLGGQWKNKRKSQKKEQSKRGRGTSKTPIFGILCRSGKVWAEIVPDVEAGTLMPLIHKQVKLGSVICSDTWKSYNGIAAKGYVHRMIEHGKGEYSDKHGNHINGLEGFWGYMKRKLAAKGGKGGIRKERLPLYVAEYVWRYNYRKLTIKQQLDKLLNLLYE